MKRHGATLEHAQPQRARAGFDSDTLSALRRVLALAHYASVGGPAIFGRNGDIITGLRQMGDNLHK